MSRKSIEKLLQQDGLVIAKIVNTEKIILLYRDVNDVEEIS
jgi:hypothetical protein